MASAAIAGFADRIGACSNWRARWILPAATVALLTMPAGVAAKEAVVLEIDGAIGPAIADYVDREFRALEPGDIGIIILRMNTPGGLDTSMRDIIRTILSSPIPVATYVAPSGARAASAGTYIAYASAIAAMAPGTNIGAATPIQLGGSPGTAPQPPAQPKDQGNSKGESKGEADRNPATEPADTETRKIVNDAVAYIRSLAELNSRNADWAEAAVRTAVSIPASRALDLHVVDVVAIDVADLLRQIDGRTVPVGGKPERLATAGLQVATIAPDWRTQLLAVVTNPNIAFMLLLLGVYGLIFEFLSPGVVAPGLLGGISLLVALFALNLLPINYAGAALVLLGIGLMVAEAHIGSFGLIGVGGIVAFAIGAIMMFPPAVPGLGLSPAVVAVTTIVSAGFFLLLLSLLLRSRWRPVVIGKEALIGAIGEAVTWDEGEGRIRVKGEIWRARSKRPLQPGARVKVVDRDGLVLIVELA